MGFSNRSDTNLKLYKHRRLLEAGNFAFTKKKNYTIHVAKTKSLISFTFTAKLICIFVFGYVDNTQGAKSLYLAKKRLEVTSPAIVVLNAFLDSSNLPKEGLSGLLWKFFWRDALIRRYLDVLFVIQLKCSTQLYYEQSYL